MKISITFLTFGKDIFGGVERSVYNLAIGLLELGAEVSVYTSNAFVSDTELDGIKVFCSEYLSINFKGKSGEVLDNEILNHFQINKKKIEEEFARYLASEQPDYVLAIDQLWGILPLIDFWNCAQCPTGIVFHMTHNPAIIRKISEMPFSDFYSVSNYVTGELSNISPILVEKGLMGLPNSILINRVTPWMPDKNEHIIFCNSRLSPEKGIEFLLQAFASLKQNDQQTKLKLCGGEFHFGEYRDTMNGVKSLIDQYPILEGSVEIVSQLSWEEVYLQLQKARVVVIPSMQESFSMAALEAMAVGVPLVATKVGNLKDISQGASVLVDYGDVYGLENALKTVLSNENMALELSRLSRNAVRSYDSLKVARDFLDKVEDI